jgi:hypothetical protein
MVPVVVITPPLNPSLTVIDVTPELAGGAHDAEVAKLAEVATLLVPNNDPVIPPEFMRSEPVINTLPLISKSAVGTALSIPIRLPVTTRVFLLKVPMTTLSSLKTSNIGNPEISFTLINDPDKLSVMPNNEPEFP